MPTNISINLPVQNLQKPIQFFAELGFNFNSQSTDEISQFKSSKFLQVTKFGFIMVLIWVGM